jgi:ArsR family transcriptional regulator
MDARQQARYAARARVVKALAHPTRLFIIDQLSAGERCVCELQAEIGADMSTVSKHLAVLRDSGLISHERRGTQVFYTLQATCVPRLLQCVENVVKDNAKRQLEVAQ